eukprot:tig00000903_g5510.t1
MDVCSLPSSTATGATRLHQCFERSARATPEATAILSETGTSWTYEELFNVSEVISGYLGRTLHVAPGDMPVVAFLLSRPLELVAGILGILRAGAAYAPLPASRPGRLLELIECTRACHVLVEDPPSDELRSELRARPSRPPRARPAPAPRAPPRPDADHERAAWRRSAGSASRSSAAPSSAAFAPSPSARPPRRHRRGLAYVMCTSGTTGKPKAVFVPHACALPNVADLSARFALRPSDVVLAASPPGFDPSVIDLFGALGAGAALLVLEPPAKVAPGRLLAALAARRVSVLQCTPAFLRRLPQEGVRGALERGPLRVLALGGEACPAPRELLAWLGPAGAARARVFNLYGTTEISVWATAHEVPREAILRGEAGPVPLGAPLARTRLALRPPPTAPAPPGRPRRSRAWWGRRRPRAPSPPPTRTGGTTSRRWRPRAVGALGDLARLAADGRLLFEGRADNLVKVLGQRVRLEEVQAALEALPHAAAARRARSPLPFLFAPLFPADGGRGGRVVAAARDGAPFLAAFLVPGPGAPPEEELLAAARRAAGRRGRARRACRRSSAASPPSPSIATARRAPLERRGEGGAGPRAERGTGRQVDVELLRRAARGEAALPAPPRAPPVLPAGPGRGRAEEALAGWLRAQWAAALADAAGPDPRTPAAAQVRRRLAGPEEGDFFVEAGAPPSPPPASSPPSSPVSPPPRPAPRPRPRQARPAPPRPRPLSLPPDAPRRSCSTPSSTRPSPPSPPPPPASLPPPAPPLLPARLPEPRAASPAPSPGAGPVPGPSSEGPRRTARSPSPESEGDEAAEAPGEGTRRRGRSSTLAPAPAPGPASPPAAPGPGPAPARRGAAEPRAAAAGAGGGVGGAAGEVRGRERAGGGALGAAGAGAGGGAPALSADGARLALGTLRGALLVLDARDGRRLLHLPTGIKSGATVDAGTGLLWLGAGDGGLLALDPGAPALAGACRRPSRRPPSSPPRHRPRPEAPRRSTRPTSAASSAPSSSSRTPGPARPGGGEPEAPVRALWAARLPGPAFGSPAVHGPTGALLAPPPTAPSPPSTPPPAPPCGRRASGPDLLERLHPRGEEAAACGPPPRGRGGALAGAAGLAGLRVALLRRLRAPRGRAWPVVLAAASAGRVAAVCAWGGALLAEAALPAPAFSSPVAVDAGAGAGAGGPGAVRVVVGCRDDRLHCLELRLLAADADAGT